MTVAVCVGCGAIKHGAFNGCVECRLMPETEIDLAYSLALTDHYFTHDVLEEISASIRSGRPRPSLPEEQEAQFREAIQPQLRLIAKRRRTEAGRASSGGAGAF